MRVLVCGDRNWKSSSVIYDRLAELVERVTRSSVTIIHGAAKGADTIAGDVAETLAMRVIAVSADWNRYGKRAGPVRNRQMLDMKPELVIAFHDDIGKSKGTKDCIKEATRRGIPVELLTSEGNYLKIKGIACDL